ncbi:MAG: DNA polymerase IV [Nitrospirae bacterium]|nr:MAG: DNA polymerase IV [Nitrospirota bacterium]
MAKWFRQILFGDVDAMFASAAVLADPSLAGKPVAVGGRPPRGIIAAASYAVRQYGVRSAMPTAQALTLCPHLILVPPDRPLYQRLHEQMRQVADRFFPAVEWTSIDEFYADATDLQTLHPDPRFLGQRVKDAILEATGLRCTIALATGKSVAKVAADAHKPDGLAVIEPGTEAAFLAPRPVKSLPGIGPKTAETLDRLGVRAIGDLLDPRLEPLLRRAWGKRLPVIQALAQGRDDDPVVPDRARKSLGRETTFEHDTNDVAFLERTLRGFLGELTHELRMEGLAAGSFTVKLKDAAHRITAKQQRFPQPLNDDAVMWGEIRETLRGLLSPHTSYRLAGITFGDLLPAAGGLFDQRRRHALAAMDAIIEKHGPKAIRLGGTPETS